MKTITSALLTLLMSVALAQDTNQPVKTAEDGLITIASRGKDVRQVIHDLFTQAKKNYVLDPAVRLDLYLALTGVEFDETLEIVCSTASLKYEIQNDIYFLTRATKPANKPAVTSPPKPKGKLTEAALQARITTRFSKTDFRAVIADIAKQAKVQIDVDKSVPQYLIDSFLINTTLKYGLDLMTQAMGVQYKLTEDKSILIFKPSPHRVAVIPSGKN